MREALYGPGGFYERPPIGARGHFVTSPHVHPIFSRLVGAAIEELWGAIGRPDPFRLVEAGAGDGTMGRELVEGYGRAGIVLEYSAVEAGAGAREALTGLTPRVAGRLGELEPLEPGVLVANELLDNLPFRRTRRRGSELVEVCVGMDGDRLVEVETAIDAELLAAPPLEEGVESTVPVGAFAFIDEVCSWLRRGYALLIDYGSVGGPAGATHAYRDHRVIEDVLDDPGSADITAGVDLGTLADRARAGGLVALPPVDQASALWALGFADWTRGERGRQGRRLNEGDGLEAVRRWDARNRASLLVDPGALGRLRWLLLSTPGLPEPGWLGVALERPLD